MIDSLAKGLWLGFCIAAPSPSPSAMGSMPMIIAAAVMSTTTGSADAGGGRCTDASPPW